MEINGGPASKDRILLHHSLSICDSGKATEKEWKDCNSHVSGSCGEWCSPRNEYISTAGTMAISTDIMPKWRGKSHRVLSLDKELQVTNEY